MKEIDDMYQACEELCQRCPYFVVCRDDDTKRGGDGMIHQLKLERAFLKPVFNGEKTFEIRKNDRGFQKGDFIRFKAVDEIGLHMRTKMDDKLFEITYVLSGWGLQPEYVAFGIKPLPEPPEEEV